MSQFPSQSPSGRRPYSFADHATGQDDFGGSMVFKPDSGVSLRGPAYGDGMTTTVRFSPCRGENGAPTPYRTSSAPNQMGDWIRAYYAMRNVGDPKITFLVHDPVSEHTDWQTSPGAVLESAIDQAVKNAQDRPGWASLLKYYKGSGKKLSRPAKLYLAFGTIWQHRNKLYQPPMGFAADNPPICLGLSKQAGEVFLGLCNAVNTQYQGGEGDWERQMLNGDVISFDSGRFVTFYTLKDGDPRSRQAAQQGNAWTTGAAAGGGQDLIGYGCYAEPTFNNQSAAVPPEFRDYLLSKTRRWDDVLWFPTIQEQAALLASRFPPEVIMYGFRNHPEWIPDNVKAAAVGAHSAHVGPGWNPPQQGYPTAPPGYPAAPGYPPQPPMQANPGYAGGPPPPAPLPSYSQPGTTPIQPGPAPAAPGWGNPYQQAPAALPSVPVTDPAMPRGGIPATPSLPSALAQPQALPPGPPAGWGGQPTAPAGHPGTPPPMPPASNWGAPPVVGPSPVPVPPIPVPLPPPQAPVQPLPPAGIVQPADGFMPPGGVLPPQPPPPLPGNFPTQPGQGRGNIAAALVNSARPPGQS